MADDLPKSLMEAVLYFTPARCAEYMISVKWPDRKIKCPACGNESCKQLPTRPVIKCNRKICQKQTSLKVGTIFEDSKLGLDKWFVAVWCVANAKNGISSHELGRAIKVTQQTAWFMEMRIREAMKSGTFTKMMGPVESEAKKTTTNKKPPGFAEFDKVCQALLAVPKTELTEQLEVRVKRKRRKSK